METRDVHGNKVYYDPKDPAHVEHHDGATHLDNLSHEEAEVYFHEARRTGSAQFETRLGKNYTLVHDKEKGTFTVEKR
jgi:hypothetical protein